MLNLWLSFLPVPNACISFTMGRLDFGGDFDYQYQMNDYPKLKVVLLLGLSALALIGGE